MFWYIHEELVKIPCEVQGGGYTEAVTWEAVRHTTRTQGVQNVTRPFHWLKCVICNRMYASKNFIELFKSIFSTTSHISRAGFTTNQDNFISLPTGSDDREVLAAGSRPVAVLLRVTCGILMQKSEFECINSEYSLVVKESLWPN